MTPLTQSQSRPDLFIAVAFLSVTLVLGFTIVSLVDAACLKDLKGKTSCGAGSCARDQRGDVYCAPLWFATVQDTRAGSTADEASAS